MNQCKIVRKQNAVHLVLCVFVFVCVCNYSISICVCEIIALVRTVSSQSSGGSRLELEMKLSFGMAREMRRALCPMYSCWQKGYRMCTGRHCANCVSMIQIKRNMQMACEYKIKFMCSTCGAAWPGLVAEPSWCPETSIIDNFLIFFWQNVVLWRVCRLCSGNMNAPSL